MPRADVASRPPIETVPGPALRAARELQVGGLSRRSLLRLGIGAALAVWLTEMVGGTAAFVWSAVSLTPAEGPRRDARRPDRRRTRASRSATAIRCTCEAAAAFVVLVDPGRGDWRPGSDPTGEGLALNVRALSKRCPHLGCRPNPCPEDFWFHCPCHQSRYDRLGIKPAGERYGPAARGMDRFAVSVDGDGVLTIDTGHITLGPLPIALGQPGVIPPLVENGCV